MFWNVTVLGSKIMKDCQELRESIPGSRSLSLLSLAHCPLSLTFPSCLCPNDAFLGGDEKGNSDVFKGSLDKLAWPLVKAQLMVHN